MGTIMAVCMVIAVLFATRLPPANVIQKLPRAVRQLVGGLVFVGGAWNLFWYSLQHIGEFWGQAALVSGILMMLVAAYIAEFNLPTWLKKIRPAVVLLLAACAALYVVTIYQL